MPQLDLTENCLTELRGRKVLYGPIAALTSGCRRVVSRASTLSGDRLALRRPAVAAELFEGGMAEAVTDRMISDLDIYRSAKLGSGLID